MIKSNVKMGVSLDAKERERFHVSTIQFMFAGLKKDDEMFSWLVHCENPMKTGADCCSEDSISFHYATPHLMLEYANTTVKEMIESLSKNNFSSYHSLLTLNYFITSFFFILCSV
jgi:hypothetical protein